MSYLKNIAVVGVTASAGKFVVDELLKRGRHTVTAITREDSQAVIPVGVKIAKVNYNEHASLVAALQGQDALFINMSVTAPAETQSKLIRAAADAKVPWILPNEWTGDSTIEEYGKQTFLGPGIWAARKQIEDLGVSSWIGITTGYWYEFSLGGSESRFGFDFEKRSVTFFDEGTTPINTTTWPQCGRGVASLLSLKVKPDNIQDQSVTLERYKNTSIYISSFLISQKDMFESVIRVTGTKLEDWNIRYENSSERYRKGVEAMQNSDMSGFARAMYTRSFFPDGAGAYEKTHELDNARLSLSNEDIDEFTKIGIEMSKNTY